MSRQLKQGPGWRLGWDATASEFKGLVGAEAWALELTAVEFNDFTRLVVQLSEMMQTMAAELMAEEAITCEVASDRIWLEAQGFPDAFSLTVLVLQGRRGEGQWPAAIVPQLVQAIQVLQVF